jgi:hypothetical protein
MTEKLVAKEWLGIEANNTGSDARLARIIDAASRHVLNYIGRDSFAPRDYRESTQGNGKSSMYLRYWPIVSVSNLDIGGAGINASTFNEGFSSTVGYYIGQPRIGPQTIELTGKSFWRGYPVVIDYRAGFQASQDFLLSDETVPITVTTTEGGLWLSDVYVKDMLGDTFTKVASDPATGEYAVDANGTYTFAAVDAGKSITITFGYVPPDVSQATLDMMGEWWKRKDRIGVVSKNLAGQESVTFSQEHMTDFVSLILQPYKNVVPW